MNTGKGTSQKPALTQENRPPEVAPPIQPRAPWRVVDVEAMPEFRLRVRFNDGTEGAVDLARFVRSADAGVFAALRDEAVFRRGRVEYGAVT